MIALLDPENLPEEADQRPYVQLFVPRWSQRLCIGASVLDSSGSAAVGVLGHLVGIGICCSIPVYVRLGVELHPPLLEIRGNVPVC